VDAVVDHQGAHAQLAGGCHQRRQAHFQSPGREAALGIDPGDRALRRLQQWPGLQIHHAGADGVGCAQDAVGAMRLAGIALASDDDAGNGLGMGFAQAQVLQYLQRQALQVAFADQQAVFWCVVHS